jgi:hypothetical protein
MAKVEKSAVELAVLIGSQLAQPELRIGVYAKASGWHAKVYAEQGSAGDLQKRVDEVTRELSRIYDLKS